MRTYLSLIPQHLTKNLIESYQKDILYNKKA